MSDYEVDVYKKFDDPNVEIKVSLATQQLDGDPDCEDFAPPQTTPEKHQYHNKPKMITVKFNPKKNGKTVDSLLKVKCDSEYEYEYIKQKQSNKTWLLQIKDKSSGLGEAGTTTVEIGEPQ